MDEQILENKIDLRVAQDQRGRIYTQASLSRCLLEAIVSKQKLIHKSIIAVGGTIIGLLVVITVALGVLIAILIKI